MVQAGVEPFRHRIVPTLGKKGKAMAHLVSILFFSGLLVSLGLALEFTIRAYRAEIVAALRGVALMERQPRAKEPALRHWHAAA